MLGNKENWAETLWHWDEVQAEQHGHDRKLNMALNMIYSNNSKVYAVLHGF